MESDIQCHRPDISLYNHKTLSVAEFQSQEAPSRGQYLQFPVRRRVPPTPANRVQRIDESYL